MADSNSRTVAEVRREIETEREQLAGAADVAARQHRRSDERRRASCVRTCRRWRSGRSGIGFLLAGGVGATARLIFRRGREGETKAALGRFRLVNRD